MFWFKEKFFIFFFFTFFISSACSDEIVFVDVNLLFSNSKLGKAIILKLDEINKQNLDNLKIKENEILKINNEIKNQRNIAKQEELDKKKDILNKMIKDFNEYKINLSKKYEDEKNNELKIFFNNISPVLEKYMLDNSINVIFDKKYIFLANNKYDITSEIIKLIDNNF